LTIKGGKKHKETSWLRIQLLTAIKGIPVSNNSNVNFKELNFKTFRPGNWHTIRKETSVPSPL
jgi:hypothetical protein